MYNLPDKFVLTQFKLGLLHRYDITPKSCEILGRVNPHSDWITLHAFCAELKTTPTPIGSLGYWQNIRMPNAEEQKAIRQVKLHIKDRHGSNGGNCINISFVHLHGRVVTEDGAEVELVEDTFNDSEEGVEALPSAAGGVGWQRAGPGSRPLKHPERQG